MVLLVALLGITAVPVESAAAAAGPDSAFTNMFASLSGSGWVGADATNSVALPDGRDCWIFSDTITSSSTTGLTFAHNSIVITGRGRPRVIANPMPQPSPDFYYWAGAAHVHGSQIWEIAQRIIQTGPGLWDLQYAGDYLAKINTSNWRLASLTPLADTAGAINWGVAILNHGPYTYIYGTETQGLASWMHVARVPKGRLDTPWSYYTSTGWTPNAANDSLRLLPGVAPAFSVIDLGAGLGIRVISQLPMMGQAVYSWRASSPVGPFTKNAPSTTQAASARGPTPTTRSRTPNKPPTDKCCSHSTSTASTRSHPPTPRSTTLDSSAFHSQNSKSSEIYPWMRLSRTIRPHAGSFAQAVATPA